jgi:hypothetical protein
MHRNAPHPTALRSALRTSTVRRTPIDTAPLPGPDTPSRATAHPFAPHPTAHPITHIAASRTRRPFALQLNPARPAPNRKGKP